MKLKFVGPGIHIRHISKDDPNANGLEEDLYIDVRVSDTADVPEALGRWLLEHEKADWVDVSEGEAVADASDGGTPETPPLAPLPEPPHQRRGGK